MRTVYAAALLTMALGAAAPLGAQDRPSVPAICADCHENARSDHLGALEHAEGVTCLTCHHIGLSNDPSLEESLRRDACVSCHDEAEDAHVADSHLGVDGDAPSCMDCHSVHGDSTPADAVVSISGRCASCHAELEHTLHADVAEDAPECTECHTSHSGEVFHPEQRDLYEACASCHEPVHPSHAEVEEDFKCTVCHAASGPTGAEDAVADSKQCGVCHQEIHPSHSEVDDDGSPSCLDCHDFELDSPMETAGPATSARCAECHEDAMDGFAAGGHAAGLGEEPNEDLPTCVTCHASHMDPGEERALLRLAATVRCVECHSQELLVDEYGLPIVADSYEDDFHGATARFMWSHPEAGAELPPIMVCSDCHGAHSVGWSEDDVVADVCRQCHEEGDDYLAGAWLGHGEIGPRHQPLIFLVKLSYYALIPFMLIGLLITIFFHLRTERRHGARVMRTEGMQRLVARMKGQRREPEEMVQRFSLTDRWEHAGSAITFILLVITGLPQTRPDWYVARWMIEAMGGIGATRIIHRVVGFTFVALMLSHVITAIIRSIRRHKLPVMMPVRKDFEDVVQTFRHYVLGERLPKVGKFDFAEKYEYWGLFLGGIVMSTTGIVLVFPELVTQFLPGIIVAAVRVVHGFEATFAVSVVILWHSWGVMLRPEVFPLDTTIFTGKMSVARLKHEHPLEYERLFPDRVVDEPDEDPSEEPAPLLRGREEGLAGA